jgi:hypothetical protein
MSELYFSLDVETDGPIAPLHSMRQIGLTAFDLTRCPIAQFKANLLPLPGASENPDTMNWWKETEEKALVRALDYCDEAGMRFGQFVIAVVAELAMEGDVISHKMAGSEHLAAVERAAFYIENGALEESMRKFVEKRRREAQDLVA